MEGISHEACFTGRDVGARQADRRLRRQSHFDRLRKIDHRSTGSPTTRRSASRPTAGTSSPNVDGHDFEAVEARAAQQPRAVTDRPSLICCKTIIAKGAPNKANTGAAHGAALGEKEVAATRTEHRLELPALRNSRRTSTHGWDARARGAALEAEWQRQARRLCCGASGSLPTSSSGACAANCRRAGLRDARGVRRRGRAESRERSPRARLRRTRSKGWRPYCRSSSAARRIWPPPISPCGLAAKPIGKQGGGNYLYYGVREFGMSADHQRAGSARRRDSVRRDVPDLLGLCAQCAAHGRTDEGRAASSSTRTIRSGSAKTDRRISRSSMRRACATFRTWMSGGHATASRRPLRGSPRSSAATAPRALLLSRQNVAFQQRTAEQHVAAHSLAAATR